MKPIFYIIILSILPVALQAQVDGIVYDRDSKDRLGEVKIINLKSGNILFNNYRGEFRMDVQAADTLVFSKKGFISDTLVYKDRSTLMVSLLRDYTLIETVNVTARRSPEELRKKALEEYNDAYRLADPGSLISMGTSGGVGLSINYIYNYFSKEGRNARRFTAYLNTLYEENVIDSIFTPDLVQNLVGLEGQRLKNFLIRYRPSYEFATMASQEELAQYIKSKYKIFEVMPDLRPLPELPKVDFDINKEK